MWNRRWFFCGFWGFFRRHRFDRAWLLHWGYFLDFGWGFSFVSRYFFLRFSRRYRFYNWWNRLLGNWFLCWCLWLSWRFHLFEHNLLIGQLSSFINYFFNIFINLHIKIMVWNNFVIWNIVWNNLVFWNFVIEHWHLGINLTFFFSWGQVMLVWRLLHHFIEILLILLLFLGFFLACAQLHRWALPFFFICRCFLSWRLLNRSWFGLGSWIFGGWKFFGGLDRADRLEFLLNHRIVVDFFVILCFF